MTQDPLLTETKPSRRLGVRRIRQGFNDASWRVHALVPVWHPDRKRLAWASSLLLVILIVLSGLAGDGYPLAQLASQPPATLAALPQPAPAAPSFQSENLISDVNPFVGTAPGGYSYGYGGGGGNTFPGATVPFGMVQWSPDTYPGPQASDPGGYSYADSAIRGFSLTHLSGAGCRIFGDVPFMPTTLPVTNAPTANPGRYSASFSHAHESASPGGYDVQLGTGVHVELTATQRTGFARIRFPAGQPETLLIEPGVDLGGVFAASVQLVSPTQVVGSVTSGHFCGYLSATYTVYFVATFNRPATSFGTWQGGGVQSGARTAGGAGSGLYVSFSPQSGPALLVKVGVSYVSTRNALANLAAENPGWDFDATHAAAQTTWNAALNHIQVTGGTARQQRTFYTALYHALLQPNTFSDANGQYIGLDNRIHTAAGYTQYANFSGWDIYRSEIPLLALLEPAATSDMMQSLVADGQQGGALPRWALANDDTGIMVGDPLAAVLAEGYAFGATSFDTAAALNLLLAGANDPGIGAGQDVERPGLGAYLADGYVPQGAAYVSASTSLEYYSEDFAIASFAHLTGHPDVANTFAARAGDWVRLYNASIGYIEPRDWGGGWTGSPGPTSTDEFVEGDAGQYVWMVPFDVAGLVAHMGGGARAARRLDAFFSQLNAGPFAPYAFMGNEPSLCAPWEYDYMGQPWKTQATTHRVLDQLYSDTPSGLPGNDDLGTMSAWYVWGALGLYPLIPGLGGFVLGSPLFPQITLTTGSHIVRMLAPGAGSHMPYIQRLQLDALTYPGLWIPVARLAATDTLTYTMSSQPAIAWASAPQDAPPSLSTTPWPSPHSHEPPVSE